VANEIELTELTDIDVMRQDGVKSPASGWEFIIQKDAAAKAVTAGGDLNEKPDIAGANKVLAMLAQLIASEASELAAGYEDETCDIALLLECVSNMKYFRSREQAGAEMAKDIDAVNDLLAQLPQKEPAAVPDDVNKDALEGATNETETEAPAEVSGDEALTKDSVAKMIEDAVAAKVGELAKERDEALAALDVLKATPIPAGVVLTAPQSARDSQDRDAAVAKAAYHERQAALTQDREMQQYHRQKAAALKAAANA
jgi:hypothetical protein